MQEATFDLSYRSALLAKQVYSACRLGSWCFSMRSKRLFFTTFPYEEEMKLLLETGGTLERAIAAACHGAPVILSDPAGLMWIAEAGEDAVGEGWRLLFLLGPVSLTNLSAKDVFDQMARLRLSREGDSRCVRLLQEIPVLDVGTVEQYARILHSTIANDSLPSVEPVYLTSRPQQDGPRAGGETDHLRWHQLEQEMLSAVREGRVDGLRRLSYPGDLSRSCTGDPVREMKNKFLVSVALCARAAVEGGVSLQVAKEREESYLAGVEQASDIGTLAGIHDEMTREFASLTAQCREHAGLSSVIQNCCNYIRNHDTEPLKLSQISSALGYSDYYLSRRFHREMGVHICDYIHEVRMGRAKFLLATTDMSLEAISEKLHYSSRNYFSKVFRKQFGISPSAYRTDRSIAGEREEADIEAGKPCGSRHISSGGQ